jgi:hypothetical protein
MWQRRRLLSATLGLLAVGAFSAEPADDIKPPSGYRQWFHVNTMIVDKGSPLFADLGGMRLRQLDRARRAQEGRTSSAEERPGLRLFHVHSLRRGG